MLFAYHRVFITNVKHFLGAWAIETASRKKHQNAAWKSFGKDAEPNKPEPLSGYAFFDNPSGTQKDAPENDVPLPQQKQGFFLV